MAVPMIRTVGALALLALTALPASANDPLSTDASARNDTTSLIVGSADFPESQLLATIYAKALAAKGLQTSTKLNIGSREVYMPALRDGSIDLLPEYSGAALAYLDKTSTARSPDEVAAALKAALPEGVSMLTPSMAQDSDTIAVTQKTAETYHLKTISDLKPHAAEMVIGGSPEWQARKEGLLGLKEVYGLQFKSFKPLDVGGPLTVSALANGQVQAADLFSTDPAIEANNFVTLQDDKQLFAAQNIVPVIATAKKSETATKVLDAVSAALTTKDLIHMNSRLADHDSIDQVADDWLAEHHLN